MKGAANVFALAAGILFSAGLLISGMADPRNVLGFLDFRNPAWNPSLLFVMGAGVLVAAPAFWWARHRGLTLGGEPITLPPRWPPDLRLVAGAIIFGIGWGLSGLCPGPALVGAAGGSLPILVFAAAMAAGMGISAALRRFAA